MLMNDHTIISAQLNEHGDLEVVRRYPSNMMFACYPPRPAPDRIVKEIYKAIDGMIVLHDTIEGRHTPAHTVGEQIEF